MSRLGTVVYDTERQAAADRVPVRLDKQSTEDEWQFRTRAVTDDSGRIDNLLPEGLELTTGVYRLTFDTRSYFDHHHQRGFYPEVSIVFDVQHPGAEITIPLELGPDGYSTRKDAQ
ncbi:MAG: hydroxyisourate hydrolase [Acidimicrobiia bacterium]|nr:hydroxyisourate hydrolase [Acidimicrobiia bacterium]